ncbi:MAG: hypothetical protein U0441_04900 [Polyangiaceae bacterium]
MIASPSPKLRHAELLAFCSFVLTTVILCGALGLRTAFYLPTYLLQMEELSLLGKQAVFDAVTAALVVGLAMWSRSRFLSKTLLLLAAIAIGVVKSGVASFMVSFAGETNPWYTSPGTMLLCAFVNVPLWIGFFPVITALSKARGPEGKTRSPGVLQDDHKKPVPALDGPLELHAAVVAWQMTVGLATLALGPDILFRLLGLALIAGATSHLSVARREENRLFQWLRLSVEGSLPGVVMKEEPAPAGVPALYAEDASKAVLYTVAEEGGSYRKEPEKRPFATIDPARVKAPRGFFSRVSGRFFLALVPAILMVLLALPMIEWVEVPPRALTREFPHHEINRDTITKIDGVTLYNVEQPGGGRLLVGYDEDSNVVVRGMPLFQRAKGPVTELADLANRILYDGRFPVMRDTDVYVLRDKEPNAKPPVYENETLTFWRNINGSPERVEVPCPPANVKHPSSAGTTATTATTD